MSSGSLKDVVKAIHSIVPATELPLPNHLQEAIQAYLDKHLPINDSDSQRLQDELLEIWDKLAKGRPERFLIFLNLLRELRPAIRGAARWIQWWETLVLPVLAHMGEEKGLAKECRNLLLDILVFEAEDGDAARVEATVETSIAISEKILEIWLKKSTAAIIESDQTAQYMESQIKIVLMSFGQRRPKELLTILNKYFVKPENRSQILSLLVNFIRQGPPHLHLMLQTPLFENLLRCLQIDTSTTVIAQAMTALTMFLPHIPVTSGSHLPALFNIYTRMLFWEQERTLSSRLRLDSDDGKSSADGEVKEEKAAWQKIAYSFDTDDESMPDLLHYFTFLYGLYPINFMSYIRKPSRYLRHANFPGADDIDIEPEEIRKRSETYREQHLLHPNFFTLTIESELTDAKRWLNHAASDVVTFCQELNVPLHGNMYTEQDVTTPTEASHLDRESIHEGRPRGLLSLGGSEEHFNRSNRSSHDAVGGSSLRRMASIASPDGANELNTLARLSSRNSQSMPSSEMNSPAVQPQDARHDSIGTITDAISPLNETVNSQQSLRSNLRRALMSDSTTTLSSIANNESAQHTDSYPHSQAPPRSPSLRPIGFGNNDTAASIASLQREIVLLKNDLSFERYLKQQHLSHIGKLRRQQVRDATVEAETQNLVNSNKQMKKKLEEAKNDMVRIRKEAERSRTQGRKWEADLTAKLRAIKEQQKKWLVESEDLRRALEEERTNNAGLKKLVLQSEGREAESSQRLQGIKIELEALERLKADVERLKARLRKYQMDEGDAEREHAEEGVQAAKMNMLKMQLHTKAREFDVARAASAREIEALKAELQNAREDMRRNSDRKVQDTIDAALAANKKRLEQSKRMHDALQAKYLNLQDEHLKLQEKLEQATQPPPRAQSSHMGSTHVGSPMSGRSTLRDQYQSREGSVMGPASLGRPAMGYLDQNLAPGNNMDSGRSTYSAGSGSRASTNTADDYTPSRPGPGGRSETERPEGSRRPDMKLALPIPSRSALFRGNTGDGNLQPNEVRGMGRGSGASDRAAGSGSESGGPLSPKLKPEQGRLYGRGRSLFDSMF